ncbi:MAG: hypothetical protein A2W19_03905 [Spirochaetes bacterium RBG_16_49_21]|nr:MAG: hypothetical protein A2W19_03905 [Spirochaetes bacterium RBG_16_49_21]
MPMKIVLSTRGSRGDVHPIIEIASALRRAGHDAVICVPRTFEHLARTRKLDYSLYSEDSGQVMQKLGSGMKAIQTALDWFSGSIDEQFEFMLQATENAGALATSVNEVASPTVAEYRKIPHYRIAYTPVLPGYQPPPLIPWQSLPGIANKGFWHMINGFTGLLIRKYINKKRHDLGLKSMPGTGEYFTARSHTILAINPTLAPPCPSWHDNYNFSYTGYCHGSVEGDPGPELIRFLEQGSAPVYIGFGSVIVKNPDEFTSLILEAATLARCRLVLGTGWTGLGGRPLPDHIFAVGDVNHAALFPLCAGVAHHGGSGTTHTAARAGVPQFIMPQIADQFYWGHRIRRLGLGPAPAAPDKITVKLLGRVFMDLINNPDYADNAKALGENMRHENGIRKTVEIIISSGTV